MPQTLLLADDSVTIQRVIELTFADEDIDVVAVSDGDEAIARLEAAPPDIVLADVGMPGKSGYEVAAYIKRSPRLAHIPVVLLTGAFEPVDQAKAARAGCDGVLAKPFEPQLVIGRVKELLARPHQVRVELDVPLDPPAAAVIPAADPRLEVVAGQRTESTEQLDDYFERLDRAFANLSATSSAEGSPASVPDPDWFGAASQTDGPVPDRWDIPPSAGAPLDLPLAWSSDVSETSSPPVRATGVSESVVSDLTARAPMQPAPADPPRAIAPQPLAEAFAMLLAAERGQPRPAAGQTSQVAPAAASVDVEALAERVTCRVLEELSDRVVRETVADIVSRVAERLVREEIERIKASTT